MQRFATLVTCGGQGSLYLYVRRPGNASGTFQARLPTAPANRAAASPGGWPLIGPRTAADRKDNASQNGSPVSPRTARVNSTLSVVFLFILQFAKRVIHAGIAFSGSDFAWEVGIADRN